MRVRAIRDLAQRSDADLFREVAEGLGYIATNALTLGHDARTAYEDGRTRAYRTLTAVATEEAAKFLILLDAIRCPRQPAQRFARQLVRFHDHLSKGIYVEYCETRPSTFADAQSWINRERREFYLDGPNDVDWIFPNEILHGRESTLYVDYVHADDGHVWIAPGQYDLAIEYGYLYHAPRVLTLVRDLYALGFAEPEALKVIATVWRPVEMRSDFHVRALWELNGATLEALDTQGALSAAPVQPEAIIDRWLFPLFSLDLSEIAVDVGALRSARDDYWYREMGV